MTNVLAYTAETYAKHIATILLFSIAFVIALVIPVFASLPAYADIGAVFIRTSSIFVNLTAATIAIIVAALLFSLLFLSFAIVAINLIVKHSRTRTKIRKEVIDGIEKYIGRVFIALLFYTAIVAIASLIGYHYGEAGIAASVAGLVFSPLFFYLPSSIVIDENGIIRAMKASAAFFAKRFDYVLLWLFIGVVVISFFDFLFITASGTLVSRFAMLVFDSLFILPFLVMLQSQCYMKRFALLKR
ncbi:hypothetical protein M1397_03985 [Candidatus Marsarchaeota archaeon]|jgi:hypothetical protein|nr:hypothetical protein [Candidatus Marsarchaeota archaeon]